MGLFSWLLGKGEPDRPGLPLEELARRLNTTPDALAAVPLDYTRVDIRKRRGGTRTLHVPNEALKTLQRTILRRLLARLEVHSAAHGFEPGRSIVSNALPHVGRDVVLKMDIRHFFPTTTAGRVTAYFRTVGWDKASAALLTRLCTHAGGLPQGAPTSPRLSNLINQPLDARLAALAGRIGATYTRYADDMTFSLPATAGTTLRVRNPKTLEWRTTAAPGQRDRIATLIVATKGILQDYGYTLHQDKKLQLLRRHQQQRVTGLVVNEKLALPRATRRRLRAIAHHLATGRPTSITPQQLAGWVAFKAMVEAPPAP